VGTLLKVSTFYNFFLHPFLFTIYFRMQAEGFNINKVTLGGLILTLGIIYGDIGTSPLYVMKAIVGNSAINKELVLGGLSCVFWTLTIQTTFKYILLTLNADNNGEGGIFSLYALLRKKSKNLIWFSIIGGSMLLADGMITPPISISSAIEGLTIIVPDIPVIPIVLTIIGMLFFVQQFGSKFMGFAFGPIMLLWFSTLGLLGIFELIKQPEVLVCINPYYALRFLTDFPGAFWLLGAVFLCTTGAEALYSDLGHCGRKNIRISWIFVKISLLLNYFGQGAWLLQQDYLKERNPFYAIMPEWFIIPGIIIATLAAIIASQALISGSFTLIGEAIRMNISPKFKMLFPTTLKGQIYIPTVNWLLVFGCFFVVLHFKKSENMEAAYGLAISLTMLTTTLLLSFYLRNIKKWSLGILIPVIMLFVVVECSFLIANLAKFTHGGYITLVGGSIFFLIMYIWYEAYRIKHRLTEFTKLEPFLNSFKEIRSDESIPKYATHLVYLSNSKEAEMIETKIVYSVFQKSPKRADYYWFLHVHVTDEPYTLEYKVNHMLVDDIVRVDFYLGFRIEPRLNLLFRKVVQELIEAKEVNISSKYPSIKKLDMIGDFKFIVLNRHLSVESNLPIWEQFIINMYFKLKKIAVSEEDDFGLETSAVVVEKVPLVLSPIQDFELKRIDN